MPGGGGTCGCRDGGDTGDIKIAANGSNVKVFNFHDFILGFGIFF